MKKKLRNIISVIMGLTIIHFIFIALGHIWDLELYGMYKLNVLYSNFYVCIALIIIRIFCFNWGFKEHKKPPERFWHND
jgi:hypothetical protein